MVRYKMRKFCNKCNKQVRKSDVKDYYYCSNCCNTIYFLDVKEKKVLNGE